MQASEKGEFMSVLMGLAALHRIDITQQVSMLYWSSLERYSIADVKMAAGVLLADPDCGQFMPKPADFVRVIDGGKQSRSALAWEKLERAMRCVGGNSSVVFDDPVIHAAVATLGQWPELCQTSTDELQFVRQRFEKAYQAMTMSPPKKWPRKLIGRYEAYNAPRGLPTEPPIPVGEVAKCRQVFSSGVDGGALAQIGEVQKPRLVAVK